MQISQTSSDDRRKQIIYVWNYLEWGGAQTYLLGLMRAVSHAYRVRVILPAKSQEKIIRYLETDRLSYAFFDGNVDLSAAPSLWRKIKRRVNDLSANYKLAKKLRNENLRKTAIQIDVAPWSGFGLLLYLVSKTKVFVTLHTAIPSISRWRKILWKVKTAILLKSGNFHLNVSNQDVKKSLRSLLSESQYQAVNVIYSSFSREQFEKSLVNAPTRNEIAEKYNFPADKIWVGSVGQFIDRKGCWVLLEALKILQQQRDDLFFGWLGTAELDAPTRDKISAHDLKDGFRFLSADEIGAARSDLLTLWNGFDIFALPSFHEGLPMALVEAMALGKACIASAVNAIPEVIVDNENGILVKAGDAAELAAAIARLADDSVLRKRLGENARRTVDENFEERTVGRKMLELYEASF